MTYEQAVVINRIANFGDAERIKRNAETLQEAFPEFEWEYMTLYAPFPMPIIQLRKRVEGTKGE